MSGAAAIGKDKGWRLILSSLTLAVSSTDTPSMVISICLVDVALAFGVSIGVAGQLRTVSSIASIVSALAMGVISLAYSHKAILTLGLLVNVLASLTCAFAPSLGLTMASLSATGLAVAMVTPMTDTYIGDIFQGERRSRAVGTVFALRTLSYLLAVQVIGLIAGLWGWQLVFLAFVAPYSLASLMLSAKALPNVSKGGSGNGRAGHLSGFKVVFSSKSAASCLLGNTLAMAAWGGMITYVTSYLRERFLLPREQAALVLSGLALGVLVGSYVGGRLVNRYGRRTLAAVTLSIVGVLLMSLTNMPSLTSTLVIIPFLSVIGGVRFTASNTLTLEQATGVRGTMMSLNSAALSLGWAIGSGVGGLALLLCSWRLVGISFGAMGIMAACIYQLLVQDSGRDSQPEEDNST